MGVLKDPDYWLQVLITSWEQLDIQYRLCDFVVHNSQVIKYSNKGSQCEMGSRGMEILGAHERTCFLCMEEVATCS